MGFVAAAVAVVGLGVSMSEAEDAEDAQFAAAQEQKKVQDEVKSQNAAKAAQERRQQVREERVRRARIVQTAQNTGTSGSSGELGSLGSLSTALGSNIGQNLGSLQTANNISIFSQNAADFNMEANSLNNSAAMWSQIGSVGSSAAMSFGSAMKTK